MSFLDDLPDDEPEVIETKEVVPEPPRKLSYEERKQEELRTIEDKLLTDNMKIVADVAAMRDIVEGATGPPQEWIDELGEREAKKRFRLAEAGWKNSKQFPEGVRQAGKIVTGIIKARATEKQAPRQLNMAVQINGVKLQLPEKEVEE